MFKDDERRLAASRRAAAMGVLMVALALTLLNAPALDAVVAAIGRSAHLLASA